MRTPTTAFVMIASIFSATWTVGAQTALDGSPIRFQDRGAKVAQMRCLLKAHGFNARVTETEDYFDIPLLNASRRFQAAVGLSTPGTIGPGTQRALTANMKAASACGVTVTSAMQDEAIQGGAIQDGASTNSPKSFSQNHLKSGQESCVFEAYTGSAGFERHFDRILALQVFLDRAHFSVGEIDGVCGSNTKKALFDYFMEHRTDRLNTFQMSSILDRLEKTGGPALRSHVLTKQDVAGPFPGGVKFSRPTEKIAERFQISERTLKYLNPTSGFRAGDIIRVPSLGKPLTEPEEAYWLEIDTDREVMALKTEKGIVARYPVTINPDRTPTVEMETVDRAPNPNYPMKIGTEGKKKMIDPGPNNPVGTDWLTLRSVDEAFRHLRGYGVHGSPEPNNISKQSSAGCIRLVNWDVEELAGVLAIGTRLKPV